MRVAVAALARSCRPAAAEQPNVDGEGQADEQPAECGDLAWLSQRHAREREAQSRGGQERESEQWPVPGFVGSVEVVATEQPDEKDRQARKSQG